MKAKTENFVAVSVGILLLSLTLWGTWVTAQSSQLEMGNGSRPLIRMMGPEMIEMHSYWQNDTDQKMQPMRQLMEPNILMDNR